MKNPEKLPDDERLWELLDKGSKPSVSPFFSRNVLREARKLQQKSVKGMFWWLRLLIPVTACLMLTAGGLTFWKPITPFGSNSQKTAFVEKGDSSIDFDTVKNLDLLVANEESSLWEDNASLQ
ncbi:MAG: hypothetical protein ABI443_07255 [Chthoniobacterales bacterium]